MGVISKYFDQMVEVLKKDLESLNAENTAKEQEIRTALNEAKRLHDSFREFDEELDFQIEKVQEILRQLQTLDRQEAKYVKLEENAQRFESAINFPMTKLHSLEQPAIKVMNSTNGDGADAHAQPEPENLLLDNGARSRPDESTDDEFMDVL